MRIATILQKISKTNPTPGGSSRRAVCPIRAHCGPSGHAEPPNGGFFGERCGHIRQGLAQGGGVDAGACDGLPGDFILSGGVASASPMAALMASLRASASCWASSIRACSWRSSRALRSISLVLICDPPCYVGSWAASGMY